MAARLNVNIDHVATVRQARRTIEPSVLAAAMICELAGADGITVHLRQDRRHIQDADVELLRRSVSTYLNLEMAATAEMLAIAELIRPDAVSLVPENPGEVTTEGGLDVAANREVIAEAVGRLRAAGIFVSIFIDPEPLQIQAAADVGAGQIEICTAQYAESTLAGGHVHGDGKRRAEHELGRIREAARIAASFGLNVAAGHGLTTKNVRPLAAIPEIEEFNIGHHIISRAVFIGLENAVREMIRAIRNP